MRFRSNGHSCVGGIVVYEHPRTRTDTETGLLDCFLDSSVLLLLPPPSLLAVLVRPDRNEALERPIPSG
ncbi:unnamed protein product [Gongylonema pulchrum]|uniref:Uncharacterized protein n=1 Tax=Gongylonema pulchrum TaxID=637853 RepID=A0A183EEH3_9BILA|nr:unnamed protein product [Gongylonema pulchrum]